MSTVSCIRSDFDIKTFVLAAPAGTEVRRDDAARCRHAEIAQEEALADLPESEKDLPVLFNEYCTTWGEPTEDKRVSGQPAI